tara:strand:- start:140 stop:547 length:408 start_codon:yes stop_codon:yes gene_type:complete
MGFLAYFLPPGVEFMSSDGESAFTEKEYFILDRINIIHVCVNGIETITINVKLNVYNSYEKRLERGNTLMFTEFSIQDLIDKNFSENLWTKCYIKIKELILNQNTQNLKGKLNLSDNDTIPTQYQYLLEIEDHFN